MKGSINFNMVRSSVSSQAKKHLTQEERTRVACSMCHDIATADRFYCPVPNVTELFQRESTSEEDLNTGTPPTPAAQRDPPCDEDLNTGTPPTPAAQRDPPCDEDLNTGTPPTPAAQRDPPCDLGPQHWGHATRFTARPFR
ncbi:unnamed protein product [Boreogadus saida]